MASIRPYWQIRRSPSREPPVAFDGTVDETPQEIQLGSYVFDVSFAEPWTPRDE